MSARADGLKLDFSLANTVTYIKILNFGRIEVSDLVNSFEGASNVVAGLNLFQNYLNEPNFKIHQEIQSANNIIIDWNVTVSLLFFKSIFYEADIYSIFL